MENLLSTWLDVIAIIPQYFDMKSGRFENITKGKILKFIDDADGIIKGELRPYYGSDFKVSNTRVYTENLHINKNPDFVFNKSGIIINSHFTQVYKFVFVEFVTNQIDTTKFECYPDAGPMVGGLTTTSTNLGYLTLTSAAWSGHTFNTGDTVYLSVHNIDKLINNLSAKYTAALVLEQTSNSQLASDGPSSNNLKSEVNQMIEKIKDPFSQLLEVSQKFQDTDPVPVEYNINEFGDDVTDYIDA